MPQNVCPHLFLVLSCRMPVCHLHVSVLNHPHHLPESKEPYLQQHAPQPPPSESIEPPLSRVVGCCRRRDVQGSKEQVQLAGSYQ